MTAVLLWLPSILWPFTISWDETTFFLVAKRSLLGELPFTTTFDNKSPLAHIFQSGAMAIMDSWTVLRLTAALLMGLSAFFLVSAMSTKRRLLPAYLVGALFLLSWVNLTNGIVWMSEVNVVLVFAFAWYLFAKKQNSGSLWLIGTGIIIGTLPLMRINWAFVAATLFMALWFKNRTSKKSLAYLALGALVPIALTLSVYAVVGELPRLWAGMIELPRGLGEGEGWKIPTLSDDQLPLYWLGLLMVVTALVLMVLRLQWVRGRSIDSADVVLLIATFALSLGAWIQPFDFPYQTLQILPFVALSIGRLVEMGSWDHYVALIPVTIACASLVYLFWINVVSEFDWRNTSQQESELVSYLNTVPGIKEKSLWIPDANNFLYWRLGKLPIIPLGTFPWGIWEPAFQRADLGYEMSESEASQYVFDWYPDLIVANSNFKGSSSESPEAIEVWRGNLESRYRPLASINGRTVWQLVGGPRYSVRVM
jgi:hypothetical protein